MNHDTLLIRPLTHQAYLPCWQAMQHFTQTRDKDTSDEVWFVEHDPVFTQGQNGKPEHLLAAGDIPVIQTDRGGQITYHGPGQLMIYTLIDLTRKKLTIRDFVCLLEKSIIDLLYNYQINACGKRHAPGIYVNDQKIGSIGLRVRKGCTYHGVALNIALDKEPFTRINPCGFAGLQMTTIAELGGSNNMQQTTAQLTHYLIKHLGYTSCHGIETNTK